MNRTTHRPSATVHGYPRQGPDRELKRAVEDFWAGRSSADQLLTTAADLRRRARGLPAAHPPRPATARLRRDHGEPERNDITGVSVPRSTLRGTYDFGK